MTLLGRPLSQIEVVTFIEPSNGIYEPLNCCASQCKVSYDFHCKLLTIVAGNTLPERTKTNAWRKVLEYVHRVETLRASKASTSRTAVEEESSDLQARIEALGKESVLSLSAERERTDDNLASKVTELSGKRELVTNMSVPTKEEGLKQDLALAHQFFDIMSKQPVAYMDKPREQARFEDRLESNETVEDLLEVKRLEFFLLRLVLYLSPSFFISPTLLCVCVCVCNSGCSFCVLSHH